MWGSWKVLDFELERRRVELEAVERRRQGLSQLITYLKKYNKDQGRKVQDKEVQVVTNIGDVCISVSCRPLEEGKRENLW